MKTDLFHLSTTISSLWITILKLSLVSISITPYCTCNTIDERMNERPADEKISRWFLLYCYCTSTCSKSMGSEHLIVFMYLLLYCNEGGHKFIEWSTRLPIKYLTPIALTSYWAILSCRQVAKKGDYLHWTAIIGWVTILQSVERGFWRSEGCQKHHLHQSVIKGTGRWKLRKIHILRKVREGKEQCKFLARSEQNSNNKLSFLCSLPGCFLFRASLQRMW